jgi:hypothetical protein
MPAYYKLCHRIPDDSTVADTSGSIGRHFNCVWILNFVPVGPIGIGPDPGPVFTHPALDPEDVRNMQTLAAIDNLAEGLPTDLSVQIHEAVAAHMHIPPKARYGFRALSSHRAALTLRRRNLCRCARRALDARYAPSTHETVGA